LQVDTKHKFREENKKSVRQKRRKHWEKIYEEEEEEEITSFQPHQAD